MFLWIFVLVLFIHEVYTDSDVTFDVKRYPREGSTGLEPYVPINYFPNKNNLCFFSYCWNRGGKCRGKYSCCECECEENSSFFASNAGAGCYDGTKMVAATRTAGEACMYVTTALRFSYVPLFSAASKFKGIQIALSYDEDFPLSHSNTACKAGFVHIYDTHGHKLLYDRNDCADVFTIHSYKGKHYLEWQSTDASKWNDLKGQLLSVDIDCRNGDLVKEYKSCLIFQIEGKFVQGDHITTPTPTIRRRCPTTIPKTWQPPATVSTVKQTTVTTEYTTKYTTKYTTTKPQNASVMVIPSTAPRGSINIVGIVAGVAAALTIGIVVAIAVFIVIKRRKTREKGAEESEATTTNLIRQPVKVNQYEDYAVPDIGMITDGDEKGLLKSHEYVAIDDKNEARTYSCIDENDYEITGSDSAWFQKRKRHSSDMSKRPLPEKPQQSENPYYCDTATLDKQGSKHASNNELYSIYDSIDAVKTEKV